MLKKILAGLGILSLLVMAVVPVLAAETGTVSCTVTPQIISVTVVDGVVDYGILGASDSNNTFDGTAVGTQTITNGSNVPADIALRSSDAAKSGAPDVTDWVLAGAVGADQFVHSYDVDAVAPTWTVFPADGTFGNTNTSTVVTLDESGGADDDATLDLKIDMPDSITDTTAHSIDITVLATEA